MLPVLTWRGGTLGTWLRNSRPVVSQSLRWTGIAGRLPFAQIQAHKTTGILQPFEKEYFRKDGGRVPVLIGAATSEEGEKTTLAELIGDSQTKTQPSARHGARGPNMAEVPER